MSKVTWADLRCGDRITDSKGKEWRVYTDPTGDKDFHVTVGITDEKVFLTLEKPVSSEVKRISDEVEVLAEAKHVDDVFGEDKAELVAAETTAETQTRQKGGPYPAAHVLTDLQLRTHLFLVHQQYVGDVSNRAALNAHHQKGHELGDGIPHTHEEK